MSELTPAEQAAATLLWKLDNAKRGPAPADSPDPEDMDSTFRAEARAVVAAVRPHLAAEASPDPLTAEWRTGRHVGRTIYAQTGPDPTRSDVLIGVMDTPELARAAVDAHNATIRSSITPAEAQAYVLRDVANWIGARALTGPITLDEIVAHMRHRADVVGPDPTTTAPEGTTR